MLTVAYCSVPDAVEIVPLRCVDNKNRRAIIPPVTRNSVGIPFIFILLLLQKLILALALAARSEDFVLHRIRLLKLWFPSSFYFELIRVVLRVQMDGHTVASQFVFCTVPQR